jgi:hypothetical protein
MRSERRASQHPNQSARVLFLALLKCIQRPHYFPIQALPRRTDLHATLKLFHQLAELAPEIAGESGPDVEEENL